MSIYYFFLSDTKASVSKVVFILHVRYNVLTPDILLPSWGPLLNFLWEYQGICKTVNPFPVLVQVSVETLNH